MFDPFEEIRRFQERMNRLFEDFERRFPEIREFKEPRLSMPVDVIDEGDKLRILADLPGFNKEDIEVYFEDEDLVIKAERKTVEEEKGKDFLRKERRYGMFVRRIAIPSEVDKTNVKAKYNNGVLEITLTKKVAPKTKINID
ncbi:MAG: Hsp20/alpha crystallin family protein [Archaeoglobales archaeon]|nr:Hsp20/alpha crystallin family protein [Archaeoglobales archaeon]